MFYLDPFQRGVCNVANKEKIGRVLKFIEAVINVLLDITLDVPNQNKTPPKKPLYWKNWQSN